MCPGALDIKEVLCDLSIQARGGANLRLKRYTGGLGVYGLGLR